MGDEDSAKKHDDQISKLKDARVKSQSVVQRPERSTKPSTSALPNQEFADPPKFVTYPEFEPAINSKAPLLSLRRLLLVFYLSAGTATTVYALSKLFLQPLLHRLIQARRDFYQHSLEKVDALTTKLSDCQVEEAGPLESQDLQPAKLLRIAEILNLQSTSGETAAHNELSFATEDLIAYLNSYVYTSAPFVGYGAKYGGGVPSHSEDSAKNDMITRVKAEIRSVKGAVLNTYASTIFAQDKGITDIVPSRNFPAPIVGIRSG